jgi:hypothetical protein
MNRRKFLGLAGGTIIAAGAGAYLLSDKKNFTRADSKPGSTPLSLHPAEKEILLLASLAPSGHNTQPWLVQRIEPFHWIVVNDKSKWLPAVDPTQRETILSIGAFLQNLEYAAGNLGYHCGFTMLAGSNQDKDMMEVKLSKTGAVRQYDTGKIKSRRTVRSNYLADILKKDDLEYLIQDEAGWIQYIPNTAKEHQWLNEQTIAANSIQSYRDEAQAELAGWIRFSSHDAAMHCDGLTTGSMEIEGIPAWVLRNFYEKKDVLKKDFREKGIAKVREQVATSAGWLLITSKDNLTATLLETGMRMQRIFLKVRDKHIAIHPMTQILEEAATQQALGSALGISSPVQFILRTGYIKNYPEPVSLRRPLEKLVII